jgi:nucleotide-binding universal stress UspA family protein
LELDNILVPVDFSDFSKRALEFALEVAEKFGARLTILHAVVLFEDDVDEEEKMQEYEQGLKMREKRIHTQMDKNRKLAQTKGIVIDTKIIRGISAHEVILDTIQEHNFDLVVMGTHGRTGFKHLFQGSVAEKIIRHSPIPVLTVHRSIKNYNLEKIVVPIDFSLYSKSAADYGIILADNFGSQLDILHVIERDIHPSFYSSGIKSIFEVDTNLKERVVQNMKEFLDNQFPQDIKINFEVREGIAHKEIVEYANEISANLIVIASLGLTGLDYILVGNTAEKIVRWANCPILTVKKLNR